MKITREIKTAILVISSMLLFIWGYSFLKGTDLLSNYTTYYAIYDNVDGLTKSSPITLNGLVVGKVNKITLEDDWSSKVELQINGDFNITENSIAELYSPGPIGGKQIAIIPNKETKTIAKEKSILQSSTKLGLTETVSNEIKPIKDKLNSVLESSNTLMNNLNQVLDAKTRENLKNSIENLNATITEFKSIAAQTDAMLAENKVKISNTLTNANKASANFAAISDSLTKANLAQTINNLEKTLQNVEKLMADVQSGKGTLGKLAKDDALYKNANKTTKELELLLQDLRLNPTRYINVSLFGKKNKPYKAPSVDTLATK